MDPKALHERAGVPNAAEASAIPELSLAVAAAAGDLSATRALLRAVALPVTKAVSGVLGSSHPDLDDVVQKSLLALIRALPAFRGECHPAGYAARIAVRVALRARRDARRDVQRRENLARLTLLEGDASVPSEVAAAERRRRVLRDLLADLPEEQAEALALRIVLGFSLDEVARVSGAPPNTIRSRVRLAKEALRKRLEARPELLQELREGL